MLLSFNSECGVHLATLYIKCKTLRQIRGNLHVVCVSGCASGLQANPCCISAVTDQTYPHRAKKHDLVINWLDVQNSPPLSFSLSTPTLRIFLGSREQGFWHRWMFVTAATQRSL